MVRVRPRPAREPKGFTGSGRASSSWLQSAVEAGASAPRRVGRAVVSPVGLTPIPSSGFSKGAVPELYETSPKNWPTIDAAPPLEY